MSILTRWLLIPPVNARLIGRFRDYRRHGASAFSATLGCFWMILAWIFIPLEHPRWQSIRAEHKNLYPHINASRPRFRWSTRAGRVFAQNIKTCIRISTPRVRVRWTRSVILFKHAGY